MMMKTARLTLRPLVGTDVERFRRLANHPLIGATTTIPYPIPNGFVEEYLAREDGGLRWAVDFQGELIGTVLLFNESARDKRAELGYWIGVDYWGQGFAQEASRAVLDYAFGERALHRVVARITPSNTGSIKVVEKIGFRYEGTLREDYFRDGSYRDISLYGLLAGELTG